MGVAERFAGQHLIGASGFRPASLSQEHIVEPRPMARGHRHQHAGRRFVEPRHVERDTGDHPGVGHVNARNGAQTFSESLGCALERHKDIGQPLVLVVGLNGSAQ